MARVQFPSDTKATMRKYDLAKWIKPLQELAGGESPDMVFILKIHAGKWDLYGKIAGGAAEPLDYDANYEVDGNTVVRGASRKRSCSRALYMTGKFQKRR